MADNASVLDSDGRRSPFGTPPPAASANTLTLADGARRGRWIALDINAADFALFFIASSMERRRIVPCFDSAYPAVASRTKILVAQLGETLARHATVSTAPCWWSDEPQSPAYSSFSALTLTGPAIATIPGQTGFAFPVYAERGQSGLVVFSGSDIAVDDPMLCDTHGRCFSLFSAVTALRPAESGGLPPISKRELECLKLTANGFTSEAIAEQLGLSVHTANQYLTNSAQKLDAVNRTHAVAKALRMRLID
jgi:DNA-binding CsgD family transcriptional regulator